MEAPLYGWESYSSGGQPMSSVITFLPDQSDALRVCLCYCVDVPWMVRNCLSKVTANILSSILAEALLPFCNASVLCGRKGKINLGLQVLFEMIYIFS